MWMFFKAHRTIQQLRGAVSVLFKEIRYNKLRKLKTAQKKT